MALFKDDPCYLVAAAYHADCVRLAANNLAEWTAAYLKAVRSGGLDRAEAHTARGFVDAAVALAVGLVWNKTPAHLVGNKMPYEATGDAMAWDIVLTIPDALGAAYSIVMENPDRFSVEECKALAKQYATLKLASDCLEVCRLIPNRFDGPDGKARRKAAQVIWREMHGVRDEPPATLDEVLRSALTPPLPPAADPEPEATPEAPGNPEPAASPEAFARPEAPPMGIEGRAIAAAFTLLQEERPVSVKAACERAGVDRSHLTKRYPGAVKIIKDIGAPARVPRRGSKTRDGRIEAPDEGE